MDMRFSLKTRNLIDQDFEPTQHLRELRAERYGWPCARTQNTAVAPLRLRRQACRIQ